jgi:class 3 adenylate cyclase
MANADGNPCEQGGARLTNWLLFGCQALIIGTSFVQGTTAPLIGYSPGSASGLSTVGQATMMLAAMSVSILAGAVFGRLGREVGFLLAALSSAAGRLLQGVGLLQGNFTLLSLSVVPASLGFGLMRHTRFAAAEAVPAQARHVRLRRLSAPHKPIHPPALLRSRPTAWSLWASISDRCRSLALADHSVRRHEPVTRLMATVYTDMVGYSRLFALDNSGTAARMRYLHRSLFAPTIRRHGGRLRQTAGDSMLITFDSVAKAVQCAVIIQRELAAENEAWPQDLQMHLRIGVDLGDVIMDGENLHGEGIIVAARLQAVCPPGGICVSRAAHDRGGKQLGLASEVLGPLRLKNVSGPVEALVLRPAAHNVAESNVISFVRQV